VLYCACILLYSDTSVVVVVVVVDMLKCVLLSLLVATLSPVVNTQTSVSSVDRSSDHCQLALPVGCSCLQDRIAISVECSGAQMTSVPKHWFASGNLVVKTLNLERNNISEVSDKKLLTDRQAMCSLLSFSRFIIRIVIVRLIVMPVLCDLLVAPATALGNRLFDHHSTVV